VEIRPPARFSRNLFIQTGFMAVALFLMLAIPSEGGGVFGISRTRAVVLVGFGLLLLVFGGTGFMLRINPARDHTAFSWVQQRCQPSRWMVVFRLLSAMWMIGVVFLIAGYFAPLKAGEREIILRLIPIALVMAGIAVQILAFQPFTAGQNVPEVLLYTIALTAAGTGLQLLVELGVKHSQVPTTQDRLLSWLALLVVGLLVSNSLVRQEAPQKNAWLLLLCFSWAWFFLESRWTPTQTWPVDLNRLALYSPILWLSGVLLVGLITGLYRRVVDHIQGKQIFLNFWWIPGLILCGLLFYQISMKHATLVNTDVTTADQRSYMGIIQQVHETRFRSAGDFNRMPLYPYIQALFYDADLPAADQFMLAKRVNSWFSLVLLAILMALFLRYLKIGRASLLLVMVAFNVFVFYAGYVKVELLYYFLSFTTFLGLLAMLRRPDFKTSLLTGLSAGLAYLSKASILPGLGLFSGLYIVQQVCMARNDFGNWQATTTHLPPASARVHNLKRFAYLLVLLLTFFAVIYPYIRVVEQKFGSYFYNVNTSIIMWFDDFKEGKDFAVKYGYWQGNPVPPPASEQPGLSRYIQTHSAAEISTRAVIRLKSQIRNLFYTYGYSNYVVSYLLILVMMALADWRSAKEVIRGKPYQVVFVAIFLVAYLFLFAWYAQIAAGRRFTYTIYLPLIFSLFIGTQALVRQNIHSRRSSSGFKVDLGVFLNAADIWMALVILVEICYLLSPGAMSQYFGA
jgi:hypothetical protein